jgi:hypothetical protein
MSNLSATFPGMRGFAGVEKRTNSPWALCYQGIKKIQGDKQISMSHLKRAITQP